VFVSAWFLPSEGLHIPLRAFWWTLAILVPLGFLLDFVFLHSGSSTIPTLERHWVSVFPRSDGLFPWKSTNRFSRSSSSVCRSSGEVTLAAD
jgi:hypothetical protein